MQSGRSTTEPCPLASIFCGILPYKKDLRPNMTIYEVEKDIVLSER